jgi:tetratricopeptide (TPR) repeat protein
MVWLKKSDHAQSLADLNRSLELDGDSIEAYSTRAEVFRAQGKQDQALADLRRLAGLKPRSLGEVVMQGAAKVMIERLSKENSCGTAGRSSKDSCL